MLKFFHGYHPDVWDALVKSGMMTEYDGVRIPQDITIREYKFSIQFSFLYKFFKNSCLLYAPVR